MKKWKVISKNLVYTSKFVSIYDDRVELPVNQEIIFTRLELRDFVSVLPIIDNKIIMVKVLRYPINDVSVEIPSGFIEDGESPEASAFRELEEETGYKAQELVSMGWYHPLSRSLQRAHLFLARKLTRSMQELDSTEQIRVKKVSIRELEKLLTTGKVTHAPTVLALQRFLLKSKK